MLPKRKNVSDLLAIQTLYIAIFYGLTQCVVLTLQLVGKDCIIFHHRYDDLYVQPTVFSLSMVYLITA